MLNTRPLNPEATLIADLQRGYLRRIQSRPEPRLYRGSSSEPEFLSPDNRCYPFNALAYDYSRGEGFVVIVIKRVTGADETRCYQRYWGKSGRLNPESYTA